MRVRHVRTAYESILWVGQLGVHPTGTHSSLTDSHQSHHYHRIWPQHRCWQVFSYPCSSSRSQSATTKHNMKWESAIRRSFIDTLILCRISFYTDNWRSVLIFATTKTCSSTQLFPNILSARCNPHRHKPQHAHMNGRHARANMSNKYIYI